MGLFKGLRGKRRKKSLVVVASMMTATAPRAGTAKAPYGPAIANSTSGIAAGAIAGSGRLDEDVADRGAPKASRAEPGRPRYGDLAVEGDFHNFAHRRSIGFAFRGDVGFQSTFDKEDSLFSAFLE